jgi:Fur family ferric uptake transcriptional regulator
MVCLICEKILEFRDDELERRQELAAKRVGFNIERHSLHLYGTCKQCMQEQRKK